MNYFELHIGDYEAATAHLSLIEDAVYCRMLRIYYRTESPLPVDVKKIHRLVRAASKAERDAVQQVLSDFFTLADDGWHQSRCDEEIARFVDGEPEREVKKANEHNRLKAHREERARLFKALTDAGQHAPWNIGIAELRALAKKVSGQPETKPETPPPPLPATAPATPATATQTPVPKHQTPEEEEGGASSTLGGNPETPPPADGPSTMAGEIGKAFKRAGVDPTQLRLTDPVLVALIAQGAQPEEFEDAARDAVAAGIERPFRYVLKAVQGRRRDAANVALAPKPVDPMAWRATTDGVFAMGEKLGVRLMPTEEYSAYERRVLTAFQRRQPPQENAA